MIRATDSTLPILCLQTAGRVTREEIDKVRPIYEKAYARGLSFICINDARLARHDAHQRALWAEWTAYSAKHDPGLTKATIMLLNSAILRGALIAVNWLSPHKIPQSVCADAAEAVEVARKHAQRSGMVVKPEIWGEIRVWFDEGYAKALASQT
jgi:hypothetical protein